MPIATTEILQDDMLKCKNWGATLLQLLAFLQLMECQLLCVYVCLNCCRKGRFIMQKVCTHVPQEEASARA